MTLVDATFEFLPATEQELQDTERLLGFPLPPLLRFIYAHIASGGFGPGGGIRGAKNGYGRPDTFRIGNDETILTRCYDRERLVDLGDYVGKWRRSSAGDQLLYLPSDVWPQQLVPLCDLGCLQEVGVDGEGQTYLWYPSEESEALFTLGKETTLRQWLQQWIDP
jgi:SMI1 / KNR4 family (SUKH-1)